MENLVLALNGAEVAKKLVAFGIVVKDFAIGFGAGVVTIVGGGKLIDATKKGFENMKEKTNEIIKKAKKDAEKETQK